MIASSRRRRKYVYDAYHTCVNDGGTLPLLGYGFATLGHKIMTLFEKVSIFAQTIQNNCMFLCGFLINCKLNIKNYVCVSMFDPDNYVREEEMNKN